MGNTQSNETRSVENELTQEVSQSKEIVRDWMNFCEADAEVSEEIQTGFLHGQDVDVDQEAAQFLQENEIWTKYITNEELEQIIHLLSTSELDTTERSDDHSGPPESKKQRLLSASSESKDT